MLAKHSLVYFFARGVPGLINFAALAIYTRLLDPEDYGQYVLILSVVGFLNVFLFEWLGLGVSRYLPTSKLSKQAFLSTLKTAYVAIAFLCILGFGFYWNWTGFDERNNLLPSVGLLLSWGLFNLNLRLKSAQLLPKQYGFILAGKAILSLAIGAVLAWFGYGSAGLVWALVIGMNASLLLFSWHEWRGLSLKLYNPRLMRQLMHYGFPLSLNLGLAFVIGSSDRIMLAWMHDNEVAGLYAAGYDLASHSLGVLMMTVNLAAYPLAVRAYEKLGREAARKQLSDNVLMLIGIALPAAVGMVILAPGLANTLLGASFRDSAMHLLPWIAVAAFISGLKSYYFDLAFQLGEHTSGQFYIVAVSAVINLALNIWLIPKMEMMGAVYATIIAYGIGLVLSIFIGKRWFAMPWPFVEGLKIITAAAVMGIMLWQGGDNSDVFGLIRSIVLGALIYGSMLILLNVSNLQSSIFSKISFKYQK